MMQPRTLDDISDQEIEEFYRVFTTPAMPGAHGQSWREIKQTDPITHMELGDLICRALVAADKVRYNQKLKKISEC